MYMAGKTTFVLAVVLLLCMSTLSAAHRPGQVPSGDVAPATRLYTLSSSSQRVRSLSVL